MAPQEAQKFLDEAQYLSYIPPTALIHSFRPLDLCSVTFERYQSAATAPGLPGVASTQIRGFRIQSSRTLTGGGPAIGCHPTMEPQIRCRRGARSCWKKKQTNGGTYGHETKKSILALWPPIRLLHLRTVGREVGDRSPWLALLSGFVGLPQRGCDRVYRRLYWWSILILRWLPPQRTPT